jgi:quercetin dioxygenase-like cupin family protein
MAVSVAGLSWRLWKWCHHHKEGVPMFVVNYQDVPTQGYGEGITKRVMIGPKQGAPTFVMRIFDLPPGASSPYHTHDWEHEVFVLAGRGVVASADGEISVEPEDAILIAPDEKHCLRNTGQDTFRFMCLVPLHGEDSP